MKTTLQLLIILVSIFVAGCSPSLPDGAKQALDAKIAERQNDGTYSRGTWSVASAKQASNPKVTGIYEYNSQSDETWCVVVSPAPKILWGGDVGKSANNFVVYRIGLKWSVPFFPDFTGDTFLRLGCDNFSR